MDALKLAVSIAVRSPRLYSGELLLTRWSWKGLAKEVAYRLVEVGSEEEMLRFVLIVQTYIHWLGSYTALQ